MPSCPLNRRELLTAVGALTANAAFGRASAQTPPSSTLPPAPNLPPLPAATPRSGGSLKVVCSTPLLADLARQVGEIRVDASAILPANADPHEYEPLPRDVEKLANAKLVVKFGLNLDAWASDLISNAGAHGVVIVATDGVATLKSKEAGFPDGDPHAWFDPRNVKVMAANIAAGLTKVDPGGSRDYAARLTAYSSQLDALDRWIFAEIATIPPARRKLVTNHDAFAYFANRYGLTIVGAVIPSLDSRAEPSAKEIANLIKAIKTQGVPAIFTESSINPKLEEQLGKEAGVKVVPNLYGDNLGSPGSGADTYIGMMETDTRLIVGALG